MITSARLVYCPLLQSAILLPQFRVFATLRALLSGSSLLNPFSPAVYFARLAGRCPLYVRYRAQRHGLFIPSFSGPDLFSPLPLRKWCSSCRDHPRPIQFPNVRATRANLPSSFRDLHSSRWWFFPPLTMRPILALPSPSLPPPPSLQCLNFSFAWDAHRAFRSSLASFSSGNS